MVTAAFCADHAGQLVHKYRERLSSYQLSLLVCLLCARHSTILPKHPSQPSETGTVFIPIGKMAASPTPSKW